MNKRQIKKNKQKYRVVIADEAALLTMTEDEEKEAWSEYHAFVERNAFCKSYKELKEKGHLRYHFPVGTKFTASLHSVQMP